MNEPYKQITSTHDWDGVSHTYPDSNEGRLPPELKKVKPSFWRRLLARIKHFFFKGVTMFITADCGYDYICISEKLDATRYDGDSILARLKELSEEDKDFFLAQLIVGDEKLIAKFSVYYWRFKTDEAIAKEGK